MALLTLFVSPPSPLSANKITIPPITITNPTIKLTLAEEVERSITAPVGENGCAITKNIPTTAKIRAKLLLYSIKKISLKSIKIICLANLIMLLLHSSTNRKVYKCFWLMNIKKN